MERLPFKLQSDYSPAGDQPQAIEKLCDGLTMSGKGGGVQRTRAFASRQPRGEILTEFVGVSATHGPLAGELRDVPETQLRIGVRGSDRAAVERFTRELAPLVLNGPPSVTGFAGGRPKVEEVVAYWPALVDKAVVRTKVAVRA